MVGFKFLKKNSGNNIKNNNGDRGFLLFENTSDVIRAESLLKRGGWEVKVMGPPPEIRKGCDLVIEYG